jgi:O-antigen/teichoic acid export membrane protein
LAGQTIWYGISTIAARLINVFLTPYLTYNALMSVADFGRMSAAYSTIPLLNVIFTYGLETAYFRFVQDRGVSQKVTNTVTISMLVSTLVLGTLLWLSKDQFAGISSLQEYPVIVELCIAIIMLDALCAIPFARLRNESRPKRYAFVRVCGILMNVAAVIFFLSWCPARVAENPHHWAILIYEPGNDPLTYILLANLLQSLFTVILLARWIFPSKWQFDKALWRQMMKYAFPMLVVGIGYIVNETFDRLMLGWWLDHSNGYADTQRGIYSACYKISIFISLFIQAFRMGAEPFFFKTASSQSPQATYARVTKYFVILVSTMFLFVQFLLPVFKYFIAPQYWVGLHVVPLLLFANIFLGIYYNLSVWYKITSNTMAGAWITLTGTFITVTVNWIFIPHFGFTACAWATFLCYGTMMILSFIRGQKVYYIPYAWKKLVAYLVIVTILFFIHRVLLLIWENEVYAVITGLLLLMSYLLFLFRVERKEFQRLPYVGRFFTTK